MILRRLVYAVGLAVAWMMLWDRFTVANLLAGILVAGGMVLVFSSRNEPRSQLRRVNPFALAWLALVLVVDVLYSNWVVARLVVSRERNLRTAIVACRTSSASPKLMSTLANICALSPGMMVVQGVDDPPTIFIHVLSVGDPQSIRGRIARIERLVIRALGTREEREAYARVHGEPA